MYKRFNEEYNATDYSISTKFIYIIRFGLGDSNSLENKHYGICIMKDFLQFALVLINSILFYMKYRNFVLILYTINVLCFICMQLTKII